MQAKDFFIKLAVNIITLLAVVHIIAGVSVDSWQATVVAALVLALLNAFLRPFIILLTLPLNILSLGFFTLVINGFMFYLVAKFVKGFTVSGFWSAFWAALLFSIISFILNFMLSPRLTINVHRHQNDDPDRSTLRDVIDVDAKDD
ncbi:MAG: phage holin family protein [Candidatus Omnitrophota bacterium]